MNKDQVIDWLLEGDVSIQYQTHRDLLLEERTDLQNRISEAGWGQDFLKRRNDKGYWGEKYYQPKWTSTHYTLLDLRNLGLNPSHPLVKETVDIILDYEKGKDGGIAHSVTRGDSDVCVNGMFLNIASYFKADEEKLKSVVDFLLSKVMNDGGFNCDSTRYNVVHSSLHSTLSVLEGITEYDKAGYTYRLNELLHAKQTSVAFILLHQLFLSDRTGEVINKSFLRFPYPSRWHYDTLRALDYFQYSQIPWDDRMQPAIDVLLKKRTKKLTWKIPAKYAGKIHFEMEKAGMPSRWNTLRALRVLNHYKIPVS